MWSFALRRVGASLIALWLATIVVFLGVRALPGDPARALAGEERDEQALAEVRRKYGLDQPVPVQYARWIGYALRGDLGESVRTGLAVTPIITSRIPITLELATLSIVVAIVLGVPTGVAAAVRRGGAIDYAANAIGLFGLSVPNFWLGLMLILVFAINLRWLPASGFVPIVTDPVGNLARMILPAFVLGSGIAAVVMRQLRSAMMSTLDSDYIRTARAKGQRQTLVVWRHALKNASLPVVTIIGIEFAFLMGGLVVTEQVFNLNGLGKLFVASVTNHDYTMTQALVMLVVTIFIFTNFIVDILYAWLDPRIRYR